MHARVNDLLVRKDSASGGVMLSIKHFANPRRRLAGRRHAEALHGNEENGKS